MQIRHEDCLHLVRPANGLIMGEVRQKGDRYEIGLWLQRRADASRARIVEQICHIETYLRERKYRDGPYALNRDRITQEWITEHAGNVPGL